MSGKTIIIAVLAVLLVAAATAMAQPGRGAGMMGQRMMQGPGGPAMGSGRPWAMQNGFPGRMGRRGPGGPGATMGGPQMPGPGAMGRGMMGRGGPGAMMGGRQMPGQGQGMRFRGGPGADGRGIGGGQGRGFGQGSRGGRGRGIGGPGAGMRGRDMQGRGRGFGQGSRGGRGMGGPGAGMWPRGMQGQRFGQGGRGRSMGGPGAGMGVPGIQGRGFGQGLRNRPGTAMPGRGMLGGQSGRGQMLRNWLKRRQDGRQWPDPDRLREMRERFQEMRDRFQNRRDTGERKKNAGEPAAPRSDMRRGPDGLGFGGPGGMMRGRGQRPDGDDEESSPRSGLNRPFGPGRGGFPSQEMIEQWRQRRGGQGFPGPGRGRMMDEPDEGDRGPGRRGRSSSDAGDTELDTDTTDLAAKEPNL